MAASGFQAEKSLNDTIANNKGKYIVAGGRRRATKDDGVLLHDWRQDGGVDFADGGQGCGGGDRVGQLRVEWMRAGGPSRIRPGRADYKLIDKPVINVPGCPPIADVMNGGGDATCWAGTGSGARQPGTAEGILWTAGA